MLGFTPIAFSRIDVADMDLVGGSGPYVGPDQARQLLASFQYVIKYTTGGGVYSGNLIKANGSSVPTSLLG